MTNSKRNSPRVLPALLALMIVAGSILGLFQLASSFTGSSNIVIEHIENWTGNLNDSSNSSLNTSEDMLGAGVTFGEESFPDGLNYKYLGGDVITISSGSYAAVADDVCGKVLVKHDGDGYASNQAFKLPSGTNIIKRCLPNIGDSFKLLYWNSSDDETNNINFTTNAFLDAMIASSSTGSVIEVPADRGVWIKFMNFDGSSVSLGFEEVRDSD